jgi:hypothetical protein
MALGISCANTLYAYIAAGRTHAGFAALHMRSSIRTTALLHVPVPAAALLLHDTAQQSNYVVFY